MMENPTNKIDHEMEAVVSKAFSGIVLRILFPNQDRILRVL